ncbi:MAG: hypothetical protein OEL89_04340 [Candidatus Peregrinibacteria bacterium]|nr:hypothetical protein [Candidatus Peregrinibacteria bacterium]
MDQSEKSLIELANHTFRYSGYPLTIEDFGVKVKRVETLCEEEPVTVIYFNGPNGSPLNIVKKLAELPESVGFRRMPPKNLKKVLIIRYKNINTIFKCTKYDQYYVDRVAICNNVLDTNKIPFTASNTDPEDWELKLEDSTMYYFIRQLLKHSIQDDKGKLIYKVFGLGLNEKFNKQS